MAKRITASDYRKELLELQLRKKALEARVIRRAKELITKYPDVNTQTHYTLKDYGTFEGYGVSDALLVIEAVEKHLAALHPHKQTTINF